MKPTGQSFFGMFAGVLLFSLLFTEIAIAAVH
jgi:hypothetical protein